MDSTSASGVPQSDIARRFGFRTIAALVVAVLTIVMIAIVTTFPWWYLNANNAASNWYLGNACSSSGCSSYQGNAGLQNVFGLTDALVVSALAFSVLTLVALILSTLWPRIGSLTLVLGVIGSILLLVAPIYLFFALPSAVSASSGSSSSFVNGFFGSSTQNTFFGTVTYTWGGGIGWYTAFAAFVVFLASSAVAYSASHHILPLGNIRIPTAAVPASSSAVPRSGQTAGMFCPVCGSHYPPGTQYCSRDATQLREAAQ
jgi:hypothetical protein